MSGPGSDRILHPSGDVDALLQSLTHLHAATSPAFLNSLLAASTSGNPLEISAATSFSYSAAHASVSTAESLLAESLQFVSPLMLSEGSEASCCEWAADTEHQTRQLPRAGIVWNNLNTPRSLRASIDTKAAALACWGARFEAHRGSICERTSSRSSRSPTPSPRSPHRRTRSPGASRGSPSPKPLTLSPRLTSPVEETTTSVQAIFFSTPLACSTSTTLNPQVGAVPCVVWPRVAIEILAAKTAVFAVSIPRGHEVSADIFCTGRASRTLDSRHVRRIAQNISTALAFLHERGYAHGSVRPEVIFVDAGAGASRLVCLPELASASGGTAMIDDCFSAPEQRNRSCVAPSPAADAWALGATLYTLLYGFVPFPPGSTFEGEFVLSGSDRRHRRWHALLSALMATDPDDRLLPADIAGGALNRLM